jgi:hypothetical protein
MNNLLTWIKDNPIRSMFLVPIFLVAGISISHVVAWYDITNPFSWAIYLSVAVEIGAITALIAATQKIKGGVWFMFGLVTFVQLIGNIFYSYKEIDVNGDLFKSWVELMSPIFEIFGTEPTDIIAHKRWLAILGGGLLPIISLTSLHFFVKYEEPEKKVIKEDKDEIITTLFNLEPKIEVEEKVEEETSEPIVEEIIQSTEPVIEEVVEEKPKSKRGRKKKVVESTESQKIEETPDDIILNEVDGDLKVQFGEEIKKEEFVNPFEEKPAPPRKLTYTKPSNISWSKL